MDRTGSRLEAFKARFSRDRIHLNNAGLAPISADARDVLIDWAGRFHRDGFFSDADYMEGIERSRASVARLVGGDPARVAFFTSTSHALSQVAFALRLGPGDEVLLFDQEYGSNLFPWREACRRAGARLRIAPSGDGLSAPTDALLERLSPATRVVSLSQVQYQTGAVVDVAAIAAACRAQGTLVVVDAMQSAGMFPCSQRELGLDAVVGGSHKWLVSPVGVGYLSTSERLDRELAPLSIGAQSYGSCDLPTAAVCELKTDATRFEPGSKAAMEIMALGASLALIERTGTDAILAEVERLARRLRAGLAVRGYEIVSPHGSPDGVQEAAQVGSIVTFRPGAQARFPSPEAAAASLRAAGILPALRGGGVRLSPHAFNEDGDIDAALGAL